MWPGRRAVQIGRQLDLQIVGVNKGRLFGIWLQEEIKRVEYRHFNHKVDRDREMIHFLWKYQARHPVRKWILLPIDEVTLRLDPHRIRQHTTFGVRCGTQADNLW